MTIYIKNQVEHKSVLKTEIASIEKLANECRALSDSESRLLNYFLLQAYTNHPIIDKSINYFAAVVGITSRHTKRCIKELQRLGFIIVKRRKERRDFNLTSLYRPSSIFLNVQVRSALRTIFSALKYIPVAWLFLTVKEEAVMTKKTSQSEYVTHLNSSAKSNTFLQSSYTSDSKTPCKIGFSLGRSYEEYKKNSEGEKKKPIAITDLDAQRVVQKIVAQDYKNPISSAIHQIRSFTPTLDEKFDLMIFEDQVIKKADYQMYGKKNIDNPFRYFLVVCYSICKQLGLSPNFSLKEELKERHRNNEINSPVDPFVEKDKTEQQREREFLNKRSKFYKEKSKLEEVPMVKKPVEELLSSHDELLKTEKGKELFDNPTTRWFLEIGKQGLIRSIEADNKTT